MANFYKFSSDKINITMLLVDSSGSMSEDADNVRKGLRLFKESFDDFYLSNSIVVSVCKFDSHFYPGDFRPVREMSTSYQIGGQTVLNYAIVESSKHLSSYVQEVVRLTGVIPKVTFVCLSDGEPCGDRMTSEQGKEAIQKMNYSGITTAFVAFGKAISSKYGKKMGFKANVDLTDRSTLVNFLGVELSNSCKEQSQREKPLGANFFSQATEESESQGYSQTTAQALEDNSWIDEI